ncbi:3990_t:CDS:2 [Dentiscutata erythropus]|uniref:3990_t:CDS:1 n=1 Tax=Dentiscutata erythropus TaxID=1348616 RepID=A0A9N8VPF5_9GLOM|nr:3990_t:CDS:2 [Dentiscutata erythropus]
MATNRKGSRERVILIVGGIKYEAYRSTFTAYPQTRLGMMFSEENHAAPHSKNGNGNVYYIDRNGRLFYCILQFYRTVKCAIPITQKQLDEELEYFMIPHSKKSKLSLRSRTLAAELDNLVDALKASLNKLALYFQKRFLMSAHGFNVTLEISFYPSDRIPHLVTVLPKIIGKSPIPLITPILNERGFGTKAYLIMNRFGDMIGNYLESTFPGLNWNLQWLEQSSDELRPSPVDTMYRMRMTLCDKFDYEDIINNCCLSTVANKDDFCKEDLDD